MKKIEPGPTAWIIIITSVILIAANLLLGSVLVSSSQKSMTTLIQNRMLDVSKTAADMLDGDVLDTLKAEDKGTKPYQEINDTLAHFQNNIELKYIYCVRQSGEHEFTFTVDPTIEDPGEFGMPVVRTDALERAAKGESAVDEEPYSDDWGRFYSAYSPVFTSDGRVGGIVAVDFDAAWYDEQISQQAKAILRSSLVAVVIAILFVLFASSRFRKQMNTITQDVADAVKDMEELSQEFKLNSSSPESSDHFHEVKDLGVTIRQLKEALHSYTENLHSEANSMITALSSDYRGVYYIDLDRKDGVCYQQHNRIDNGLRKGAHFPYPETVQKYAETYITEEYREDFLKFIEPEAVKAALAGERVIAFLYMTRQNGQESYEMVKMAGVRHPEERTDGKVHALGMGFADVDKETRKTLEQSRALSDALSAAEAANKAKTVFFSNMSHEIRTPMNAIIGLDRIALNDDTLSDTTREYLEKIGSSADHLLMIINDILDMSRIEAGRMVLHEEAFSLDELLEQIDVMIKGQCSEKGLAWDARHKNSGGTFVGDDTKLKQVLINILGNSVKFTPKGGSVSFTSERTAEYENSAAFRFVMKDTGIGMNPEYLPKLFEPFSQEDPSTKTKFGSTGLGMSITKSIVEMMDGDITVESKKNEGTTFTVTVTLLKASSEEEDAVRKAKLAESDAGEEKISLQGLRVLLAEDIAINTEIAKMILSSEGMETEHALNGKEAVEMYEKNPPHYYDAILMDMRMPEMDGLEATRFIRAMDKLDAKTIPIIALTANAFQEDVQRSLQAGLNAHLSKPIEPNLLKDTLRELIFSA